MADGCLVVYKPKGCSSHDIIDLMRQSYPGVKCGHAGTLDPMAQGVLLVFMGRALKLLSYIPKEHLDKAYLMRVTLGKVTDTYDATGQVIKEYDGEIDFDNVTLQRSIEKFIGEYEQLPPAFSAIKVNGKRAYELARAGKEVKMKPRKVNVSSIRLVSEFVIDGERNLLLRIHCSRGTYVRSIAHDLGQELECGAHLSYLLRERVGKWSFHDAFPIWKIKQKEDFTSSHAFMKFGEILPFPKIYINKKTEERVLNGMAIGPADIIRVDTEGCDIEGAAVLQVISEDGKLIALYGVKDGTKNSKTQKLRPLKVFPEK